MSTVSQQQLLGPLLRHVSRSFYLTLRVLPRSIRPQVSLAYLLARASDTIADTAAAPRDQRVALLERLRNGEVDDCTPAVAAQAAAGEAELIRRLSECYELLRTFAPADQERIRELQRTIIDGQIFDLQRFPDAAGPELVALADDAETDRYTYLVAGCVGEFWTRMCVAHLEGLEGWKDSRMEELGVRFGKGLQLVNILRDLPMDLRMGRCYLPVAEPRRLLDPSAFDSFRGEYHQWLNKAVAHLACGWDYTLQIPSTLSRLRLACTWPIWIGLMTIARLRQANPLDVSQRVKISRGEVYGVMLRSWLARKDDRKLDEHFAKLRAGCR